MTRTEILMGTVVTIQVVKGAADDAIDRAFDWFRRVESCCSRFDPSSELMQLTAKIGEAVTVSPMLFEAVRFAAAVAAETGGAFDPTVGLEMETRGFNREYSTGRVVHTSLEPAAVSYRDLALDPDRRTITLLQPMVLDLGAVAKGLAVDTAARELEPFEDFAIDAGGDLYLGGRNPDGEPWSVGIRHPRLTDLLIETLSVSDRAVCTSGDYERQGRDGSRGHILDPRTGKPADDVTSVTVMAPTAMLADAVATAAFVLGPEEGMELFDRLGVDGLIVSPAMETYRTRGLRHG